MPCNAVKIMISWSNVRISMYTIHRNIYIYICYIYDTIPLVSLSMGITLLLAFSWSCHDSISVKLHYLLCHIPCSSFWPTMCFKCEHESNVFQAPRHPGPVPWSTKEGSQDWSQDSNFPVTDVGSQIRDMNNTGSIYQYGRTCINTNTHVHARTRAHTLWLL